MICGSFLLAATLNRSAMEEVPEPAMQVPVVAPLAGSEAVPSKTGCAEVGASAGTQPAVAATEPASADLMVNGTERCSR